MAPEERLKDVLAGDATGSAVAIDPWEIVRKGRRRRRMRALGGTFALTLAAAGVAAAGWLGLPREAGTTSADQDSGRAVQPAGPAEQLAVVAEYERQLGSWVSCLRENGLPVQAVGDTSAAESVYQQLAPYKGEPGYERATSACSSLVPVITPALEQAWGQDPGPLLSVGQAEALREYADCMHRNGARSFPTPGANGLTEDQWIDWNRSAGGGDEQAALKACGPFRLR